MKIDKISNSLEEIENQLYAINSRNISMRWIGMRQKPTDKEISDLNNMLGFIIKELRTLRETGELDIDKLHKEHFKERRMTKIKECEDCGSRDYPYHELGCTEGDLGWVEVKSEKEQ